jgi:hypothetical protein
MSASAEQVGLERLVGSRLRLTLQEIINNTHLRQAETYGPSYQGVTQNPPPNARFAPKTFGYCIAAKRRDGTRVEVAHLFNHLVGERE